MSWTDQVITYVNMTQSDDLSLTQMNTYMN